MTACDWDLIGCDSCCDLEIPPDIKTATQAAAVNWLWEATNRRYGNCDVTILPCINGCRNSYGPPWVPYRAAAGSSAWVNVGCVTCGGDTCACSTPSQVTLPTPGEVLQVELDGVVLDPVNWRLDNRRFLLRVDGGSWPTCQDLSADPPTWAVTYTPGWPVPEQGQLAAAQLACQLARKACGHKCDLPSTATVVTRQGVTVQLAPGDKTGLWLVDNWVEMVNRPRARVWSPDLPVVRSRPPATSP